MKKPSRLFIFFLFLIFNVKGQNLVPNGDFEQYSNCPTLAGQLNSLLFWINPNTATSDYFRCLSQNAGVPINVQGYQVPHSDSAYCGIVVWYGNIEWREYIESPLTSPLIANTCYHLEMYMCLGNRTQYTLNTLGAYFSPSVIMSSNYNAFPVTPQLLLTTNYLTDTLNWTLISGDYTATGGENYLTIGNFYDNLGSDTAIFNSQALYTQAFFYIDDVSLTSCTGIEEQYQNDAIKIYPNPVKDLLNVQISIPIAIETNFQNTKAEIKITDVLGKEIFRNQCLTSDFRISTSNFNSGIYFVEINDGKNIYRKKILKE